MGTWFLHHGIIQSNTEFFSFEICQLTQINEDYLNAVFSGILCSEFSVVKIGGLSNLRCYTPTVKVMHFVLVTNGDLIIS